MTIVRGAARRMRRGWRWFVMFAVIGALAITPAIVRAVPVDAPDVDPVDLRARIVASESVAYQGYAETRGGVRLPNLDDLDGAAALFGETSHLRAWVRSPDRWRVDRITLTGEEGMYRGAYDERFAYLGGMSTDVGEQEMIVTWSSERNDIDTFVGGDLLRIPRPADLLPPELGRRLVRASTPEEVTSIADARVAGRAVAGIRITPRSERTLIEHADVWADVETGLPVRVSVVPTVDTSPILETKFLELSLTPPSEEQVTFHTTPEVMVANVERFNRREVFRGPELDTLLAVLPGIALPDNVGSLARRNRIGEAATSYGDGFDLVGVVAVPAFFLDRDLSNLPSSDRPWGATVSLLRTPIVNAMLFTHEGRTYLVGGTVDLATLDAAAADVARNAGMDLVTDSEASA